MTEVFIAPYTDVDKDEVIHLILNIQQKEFEIPIDLERQPDLNDIPGFYQVGNGNFWVARIGDVVVGTIALIDIGKNRGALRKMFVNKNHRGKDAGVGQRLLDTLLTSAEICGFKEILLGTTEKFVAAQRFYEKNGFVEIEKKELPTEFPVMTVDVKFYKFDIPE